jgi:hypothetical protein
MIVKPLVNLLILLLVQFHLNRLQRLDVQDIIGIVEWRLFVVEWRKAHSLEMTPVSLLASHHHPHRAPLRQIDGLDHPRYLVDERNGARDVIEHAHVTNLLPRHGHVLDELHDRMWHVFERAQVHALVVTKLSIRHVAVIAHYLTQVLRWHVLFLSIHKTKFTLLRVSKRVNVKLVR